MKLIPQNEIDEAALKHAREYVDYDEQGFINEQDLMDYAKFDFAAGVEFAESKFEKLTIEFAHYLGIETDGSLVAQFIKDRNEV